MTFALIVSVEVGDASALALLESRYAAAKIYSERHRIAIVLLGNVADDSAIWNEIYADAQLAVHFAETDEGEFNQWCEKHDFYAVRHGYVLSEALSIASIDPRSRALLRKALASKDSDIAFTAVCGLAGMKDVESLPDIEKVLERHHDAIFSPHSENFIRSAPTRSRTGTSR
jgi:hypothetical protein